jgi:uncharacterized protein (TIRG00374 family)
VTIGEPPTAGADASPDAPPISSQHRALRRGVWQLASVVVIVALLVVLLPGLGSVKHQLSRISVVWLVVATALEVLSTLSYVLLFHRVFCPGVAWRISSRIGMAELGVDTLIPAGGASGLALGAWVLRRRGMSAERIPVLSVGFFLLTSLVNVGAVVVLGLGLWLGLFGGRAPIGLTLIPAVLAAGAIVFFVALSHRVLRRDREPVTGGRVWRFVHGAIDSIAKGVGEALALARSRDPLVYVGAIGYWVFDNAVLWVCLRALGHAPPFAIVGCAYLIGQMGGALPLPLGIGGVDAGLIGVLVLFSVSASLATAAVIAYRAVQLWVPAIFGGAALLRLRRAFEGGTATTAAGRG